MEESPLAAKLKIDTRQLTLCAVMAAVMCVLAPISIPIGPISITGGTLAVFLTVFGIVMGLVLGRALHAWMVLTVEVDIVMFGRTAPHYAYELAAVLTALFSVMVNIAAHFKLKKVEIVESL